MAGSLGPNDVTSSYATPAATVAMTIEAWLYSVPYHGIWPRSSRASVVPIAATTAPAAGPPRTVAARTGAAETDTTTPRGSTTGRALASSVATVQKTIPGIPPMGGWIWANVKTAAITTIAAAVVPRTSVRTLLSTARHDDPKSSSPHHYQPFSPAPPASARATTEPRLASSAGTRRSVARMLSTSLF